MYNCAFAVAFVLLHVMDLSEEKETLGSISSEAFSASSEILSEETDPLMTCPTDDCADLDVSCAKQGSVHVLISE